MAKIIDLDPETRKNRHICDYIITTNSEALDALTPEMERKFEQDEVYEQLEEMVQYFKDTKESKQNENKFKKGAVTAVKYWAIPIAIGAAAGFVKGKVADGAVLEQTVLHGVYQTAILSTLFGLKAINKSKKMKRFGQNLKSAYTKGWEAFREVIEEKAQQNNDEEGGQTLINVLETFGNGIKYSVMDPDTAAKTDVLNFIGGYKPKDPNPKYVSVASGIFGVVKWGFSGWLLNVLTPGAYFSLDLAASTGAATHMANKALSAHEGKEQTVMKNSFYEIIEGMDDNEKLQLKGALVKRWYGTESRLDDLANGTNGRDAQTITPEPLGRLESHEYRRTSINAD